MRKGLLGSVAALVAGAGAAWGQPGAVPGGPGGPPTGAPPGAAAPLAPPPPLGGAPTFGGIPSRAIPGNAGFAPAPLIMPPGNFGPAYDPLGIGPPGGFGPPPGPMYPMPGPVGADQFQPAPPMPNVLGPGGEGGQGRPGLGSRLMNRDLGYGAAPRWWVDGEYLLWFTRGQNVRYPLLTTSAPSDAGVLGAASTAVIAGDRGQLGYNAINGVRASMGFFGDEDRRFGFQMTGFILERAANIQQFGSLGFRSGIPVLARPFMDFNGRQSTVVLSGPDFGAARVEVGANTQMWSVEPVGVWNLYRSEPGERRVWSLDFIAGYKHLYLKEELFISSRSQLDNLAALPQFTTGPFGVIVPLPALIGPAQTAFGGVNVGGPAVIEVRDRFTAVNKFNGFVFGLKGEARYGMVTTSGFAKVAVGNMHERVVINGGGAFFDPTGRSGTTLGTLGGFASGVGGGNGATYGGVLANASNLGTFIHDRFTYVPEVGSTIGIALTRGMTGYIGVNVLFLPHVVRPGDLVSPVVSSAAIPFSVNYGAAGAARAPGFQFVEREHWVGGLTAGFMLRY